jgi:predicted enzyme related to lactoylglutathione lyase
MSTDCEAAKAFYAAAVGWGTQVGPVPGTDYTMFTAAARPVGGLMELPEECRQAGISPGWTGYVAVDDVDAAAALAVELGAVVRVPPTDIPSVGRFAIITDPQKARLALFRATGSGQDESPPAQDMPGGVGWHELWAADGEAAFAFYSRLCGWQKAESMDTGTMGLYQMFSAGGTVLGGIVTKPPTVPVPLWFFYFNVGDIDAAAARVGEAGGHITNGPMAVPGGGWIVHATDPQGAMFALHGRRGG